MEAALIYPLVILMLAGMIRHALFLYAEVQRDCQIHQEELLSTTNPANADICLIMRGKWLLP